MYFFLFILTIAAYSGHQGWRLIFNNFAVEIGGVDGFQMGVIQSVREVPGFLAMLVIYVILVIREHKLAALSICILGASVGLTGFFPTYYGIVFTTLAMSFGFHYYETLNQSLTLQYFSHAEAPLVFARLRSIASVCNIGVGLIVVIMLQFMSYLGIFAVIGFAIFAAGFYCLSIDPTEEGRPMQNKGMVFRAKYWLFYVLTFLAGARRQVFVAFSVFLMVDKFHFSAWEVALLFVVNNTLNYFINPYIGKAVNRFGERTVLSVEYFNLIWIFLVYAYTDSKMLVAAMYVLDHIFFNFHFAIRTFFHKIGDPKDIAPSMAVGFTINHIAAVAIPVLGGLAWVHSYKIPFVGAAVLSALSLLFVQFIRIEKSES